MIKRAIRRIYNFASNGVVLLIGSFEITEEREARRKSRSIAAACFSLRQGRMSTSNTLSRKIDFIFQVHASLSFFFLVEIYAKLKYDIWEWHAAIFGN